MSAFPRGFGADPATSHHPLFRFLDDFDVYQRSESGGKKRHGQINAQQTFIPKFNVAEEPDQYVLHGELPGIEQKDVELEFTDAQTLSIHGHTEHSYTSGAPQTGRIGNVQTAGAIKDGSEGQKESGQDVGSGDKSTAVAKSGDRKPQSRYWISERSLGEFSRQFSFPDPVDQDAVKASMKNGILEILVPKAKRYGGKKISIS